MNKIILLFSLNLIFFSAFSQKHGAGFTMDPDLYRDQWGFVVLERGHLAIKQTEISVDDYMTFLEAVSRDSSDACMETLIPSKECAFFPFVNTENGFKNDDPTNPKKIKWIDEVKFMAANNYPPKEKIKGIDNSAFNPYEKPITGISFEQANAFANWATATCNKALTDREEHPYRKVIFRLPTPKEFENLERRGMEECTYKDKTLCPKAIAQLYEGKNEKGCALCNCAGKDTCWQNLIASKHLGNELYMVYSYNPSWIGLYNMPGNAAEMTSEKGIAKGGSYLQVAKDCGPESVQKYDKPEKWLGLRLIAEVVDGGTMMPLVSSEVKTSSFKPNEEGDYILMKGGNYPDGICIFKKTGTIQEVNAETAMEKRKASAVNNFFASADKLNLQDMWTLEEPVMGSERNYSRDYNTLEYKKDGKIYRVLWATEEHFDNTVSKLDKFVSSFWKL